MSVFWIDKLPEVDTVTLLASLMAGLVRGRGCLLQLFLGLCLCAFALGGDSIRLVDVFPFGVSEGDNEVPAGNDGSVTLELDTPILYFGELRQSITVSYV